MTEDEDRGVALERTALAWNRTGLSALALGLGTLRLATEESGVALVIGLVLSAGLVVQAVLAYGHGRRTYLARRGASRSVLLGMASAGSVAAAGALALALLP